MVFCPFWIGILYILLFFSPGYVKKKACPRDPAEDCLTCGPDQYVNLITVNNASQKPRCDACVSCSKGLLFPTHTSQLYSLSLYFIHTWFVFYSFRISTAKLSILGYWVRQQNVTLHIIYVTSCVTWEYPKIRSSNAIPVWFLPSVLYYKPLSTDFSNYSWLKLPS